MSYKRKGSPYYQCRRKRLPGYGDTGQISSAVKSKRVADRMERLLEELAERALLEPSWTALLDAVCDGTVALPDVLAAKNKGKLDHLRVSLNDPVLAVAVEAYRSSRTLDRAKRHGFDLLLTYSERAHGKRAKLSILRSGRTITELCRAAEADPESPRKRNSVRRYLLRAVSALLRHEWGAAERDRVFAEVDFPAVDDTREVHLTPAEIGALLSACTTLAERTGNGLYHELRTLVRFALQTSADRGVLLAGVRSGSRGAEDRAGLLVRHVQIFHADGLYSGEAFLPDTKSKERTRTVPITDGLCRELLVLAAGKGPHEAVFSMRYADLDHLWKMAKVEAAASLEEAGPGAIAGLRFKDLRAQTAIYGEEAGIPLTVMARAMGHADESMTRRYQQRGAVLSAQQAEAIEAAMFREAAA